MNISATIVVIFTTLTIASSAMAAPAHQKSNILFVFSEQQGMVWEKEVRTGFSNALATTSLNANLFFEYMDEGRFNATDHPDTFKSYLVQKYSSIPLDYVIYQAFPAAQVIQSQPELFATAHKIFLNPGPHLQDQSLKNTSIIEISANFDRAARELLSINPNKKLYLVAGATTGAQIRTSAFKKAISKYDSGREVITLAGLPLNDLLTQVSSLPQESVIIYLLFFRDVEGKRYTPYQVAEQLSQRANVPIFSVWTPLLGSGITGGYLLSGELVGDKIAASIIGKSNFLELEKTTRDDIHGFFFDWRELKKWKISESRLPAESKILYKEDPFYIEHMTSLALGALGIIVLISFFWIFLLKKQILLRHKAEEEIKTLQGILPICMHCKQIRNDEGYWVQLETYISTHSMAEFSHGICNICAKTYYPKATSGKEK